MYHCIIYARDIHCNCFSYYTIYTYISESKNESSDDTSTGPTPFVKAMGYLILNLRDTLNRYVLEKRQMIVSYLLYSRWSDASIPHATSSNFRMILMLDLLTTTLDGTILAEQQR